MGYTKKANRGVTLIELMVVVAVIGMLAAIAIPSYRSYTIRANRASAKTGLMSVASQLERCYTRDNVYNGASCNTLAGTLPLTSGTYQIAVDPANGGIALNTYALKAVPQGNQANDAQCGTFTVDDKNTRGISGTSTVQDCWGH